MSESLAENGDVDGSMLAAQQAEAFGKQHDALLKQFTEPDRLLAGATSQPWPAMTTMQPSAVRPPSPADCLTEQRLHVVGSCGHL